MGPSQALSAAAGLLKLMHIVLCVFLAYVYMGFGSGIP